MSGGEINDETLAKILRALAVTPGVKTVRVIWKDPYTSRFQSIDFDQIPQKVTLPAPCEDVILIGEFELFDPNHPAADLAEAILKLRSKANLPVLGCFFEATSDLNLNDDWKYEGGIVVNGWQNTLAFDAHS